MWLLKRYGVMDLRLKKIKRQKKLKQVIFGYPLIILIGTLCLILVIQNFLVYQYRQKLVGVYMRERKAVLDSYYMDQGYEGFYNEKTEVQLLVYHMVLGEKEEILSPFKEYEEEETWELAELIAQKRNKNIKGEGTQGKIKYKDQIYYYETYLYEGRFDDFFILKETKNPVKYEVILYANITVIEQFANFINRGLLCVMTLAALLFCFLMKLTSEDITKSFKRLKGYIESVERKEGFTYQKELSFQEFDRIARALYQMQKRVQKAEQKQERFFQNASHELRTPLMSIQGYGEGILYDTLEDHKAAAEIIVRNSQKMSDLVEEILFLSKMEMDNHFAFEKVEIISLLKKLVEEYGQRSEKVQIKLSKNEESIVLLGNHILLERALGNVLSNGLRYAQSKIHIKVQGKEKQIFISVENDGEPISQEESALIFKRFYKGKKGVSGIGLAITKEAVIKMKGKVWAEPREDMTQFSFLFPRLK